LRIKALLAALVALALMSIVFTGTAAAKHDGGKTIVQANVNDPGDGGGSGYPLWTGDCRLTGGLYNEGWYYMWPGNQRRDKCHDGWYTVEFWNGSYWYLASYSD